MKISGLEFKRINFNERRIESNKIVNKIILKYTFIFFTLYYLFVLFYNPRGSYFDLTSSNLLYFAGFYFLLKFAETLFHFRYCEASLNINNNKTISFIMVICDMLLLGTLGFIFNISVISIYFNFALFTIANNVLITYLAPKYNFFSTFVYILLTEVLFFLLPVYPNLPSYTNGIILLLLPVSIFIGLTMEKDIIDRYGDAKDFGHILLYIFIYIWLIFSLLSSNLTKYKLSIMNNNSMEGCISKGDLLIVRDINKLDLDEINNKDIIQFKYKEHILTHRIVKLNKAETISFTTMGDNNSGVDYPDTELNQVVSKVEFIVPNIGPLVDRFFNID